MIIKKKLLKINKKNKVNLTIGTFDSFHNGHLRVLDTLSRTSKTDNAVSCIITFSNRPKHILNNKNDGIILDNKARIKYFKKSNVDYLFFLNFNSKFAKIKAKDFINNLYNLFNLNKIIVGKDFKFGYKNSGNIKTLKKWIKNTKSQLIVVKEESYCKKKISTTLIKSLLKSGQIKKTNKLLNRNYSIQGKVIKGDQLGIKIGFPTINLKLINNDIILPQNAVYAVYIEYSNNIYYGMAFIGINNMNKKFVIEANIFNFNKKIYNKKISLFFIKKLRKEIKFIKLSDLKQQLSLDKKKALKIIKKYSNFIYK